MPNLSLTNIELESTITHPESIHKQLQDSELIQRLLGEILGTLRLLVSLTIIAVIILFLSAASRV